MEKKKEAPEHRACRKRTREEDESVDYAADCRDWKNWLELMRRAKEMDQ